MSVLFMINLIVFSVMAQVIGGGSQHCARCYKLQDLKCNMISEYEMPNLITYVVCRSMHLALSDLSG